MVTKDVGDGPRITASREKGRIMTDPNASNTPNPSNASNVGGQQYQQPQYQQPYQQGYQQQYQQPQYGPTPGTQPYYGPYTPTSTKSKIAAGLLGVFLGMFGVHNFYLGKTRTAVIQLLLTLVGWMLFGIGPAIAELWGLIEGILILVSKPGSPWHQDAQGLELQD